ncbi:MAG: WD40/YVTN/BNR-like repeat-containing protein [Alphaproteobacteria bacterium]
MQTGKLGVIAAKIAPWAIIAGLLIVSRIEPAPVGKAVQIPPIGERDRYYGIQVPEPGVLWMVGNGGKIIRSEDDGVTWKIQETPTDLNLMSIAAWDKDNAVVVGNTGVVLVTRDGGASWEEREIPKSNIADKLIRVRIVPGTDKALAVGILGKVLLTEDKGDTWEQQYFYYDWSFFEERFNDLAGGVRRVNQDVIRRGRFERDIVFHDIAIRGECEWMAIGEFGYLVHTKDCGYNWRELRPAYDSIMSIKFRDKDHGVIVGGSATILVTADGGENWDQLDPEGEVVSHLYDVEWVEESQTWVATGENGVAVKSDAAADTWTAVAITPGKSPWFVDLEPVKGDLYVCGENTGVLTVSSGDWVELPRSESHF